jgi:hypothetical protein
MSDGPEHMESLWATSVRQRGLLVGVSQNGDTMIPRSGSFSSRRAVAVADSRSVGRPSQCHELRPKLRLGGRHP